MRPRAKKLGMPNPFLKLEWDFHLAPDSRRQGAQENRPERRGRMIWRVRRVLTGHDAQGRSTFIADGEAPNVKEMASMPGLALTDLWETGGAPASNAGDKDAAARPVRLEPPKNGTILRIVEFPPDSRVARERRCEGGVQVDRRRPRQGPRLERSDDAQDQHGGLHHRAQGRDLRHHGKRRDAAARRRHPRAARHQPLLERARQRALHRRRGAGERQAGRKAGRETGGTQSGPKKKPKKK